MVNEVHYGDVFRWHTDGYYMFVHGNEDGSWVAARLDLTGHEDDDFVEDAIDLGSP